VPSLPLFFLQSQKDIIGIYNLGKEKRLKFFCFPRNADAYFLFVIPSWVSQIFMKWPLWLMHVFVERPYRQSQPSVHATFYASRTPRHFWECHPNTKEKKNQK